MADGWQITQPKNATLLHPISVTYRRMDICPWQMDTPSIDHRYTITPNKFHI